MIPHKLELMYVSLQTIIQQWRRFSFARDRLFAAAFARLHLPKDCWPPANTKNNGALRDCQVLRALCAALAVRLIM